MSDYAPALSVSRRGARRRRSRYRTYRTLTNYAFIAPYLVFFLVFSVGPIAYGFYMSLFHWQILAPQQSFSGLDNYTHLIHDDLFWTSFRNTLYFTVLTVAVEAAVALAMALALRANF